MPQFAGYRVPIAIQPSVVIVRVGVALLFGLRYFPKMGLVAMLDLTDARDLHSPGQLHLEFEVKNGLPLFWKIMFTPQDERIDPDAPEHDWQRRRFFHTSRESALTRLHAARGVFDAADQSTAELYFEWLKLIASSPARECLMRGDLFGIDPGTEGVPARDMGLTEDEILNDLVWMEWHTGMLSGHLIDQSTVSWPPTDWAKSANFERRRYTYQKWDPT